MSQSQTYRNWSSLTTYDQFVAESCGSLPIFTAHGFPGAWGMFNFPSNTGWDNPVAEGAVQSCFAFLRKYGALGRITTRAEALTSPRLVKTLSVMGGMCNAPDLPCYTMTVVNDRRYTTPDELAANLNPAVDQYAVVQFYRFVDGARLTGTGDNWDCTSPDPREHWTTEPEMYCWNDFQRAIGRIGPGVTVTDPATVAVAWGVTPG